MRILTIMLAAAVFFLVGMMTGIHVSEQYEQPQNRPSSSEFEQKDTAAEVGQKGSDTTAEMLEQQKRLKEKQEINVFSDIGKSLDVFAPASEPSREY
ncbi:hypothetical protein SAMN05518683_103114 [Salibacterium halotolerans]|uniref:Uncharacterized protein n=2 Tax=Salibacterium halotolerans TaxID=1884432 RepID=A0A1I5NF73_9BACI|nr:hypothetical protein SAMN05518683_103114 [Salibacterium halotolerans]